MSEEKQNLEATKSPSTATSDTDKAGQKQGWRMLRAKSKSKAGKSGKASSQKSGRKKASSSKATVAPPVNGNESPNVSDTSVSSNDKNTIGNKRRSDVLVSPVTAGPAANVPAGSDSAHIRREIPRRTLELILNKAPVSIFLIDVNEDGTFTYAEANEQFLHRNGLTEKTIIGKTPHDIIPKLQADELVKALEDCVRSGKMIHFEQEIDIVAGRRWVERTIEPVFGDDDKTIIQLLGLSTDITEQKDNQQKLARQAARQKALTEIGDIALRETNLQKFLAKACEILADSLGVAFAKVQEVDEDTQYLNVVASAGWDQDDLKGYVTEVGADSLAGYAILSNEPVVVRDVETEKRFKPSMLWSRYKIRSAMSVLIEGLKGPYGVLTAHSRIADSFVGNDVKFFKAAADMIAKAVQHYQAEGALKRSEKLISSILESADIGICVCDHDGRFVQINDAFTEITGYEKSQLHGRTFTMLYPINRREEQRRGFENFLNSDNLRFTSEEEIQHKDGRRIEIQLKGSRLKSDITEGKHLIFTVSDITQRKQTERSLRLLRSAAVNAKDGIVIMDAKAEAPGPEILFVNTAFEDITGFSAREVIGQTLMLLDSPHTDRQQLRRMQHAMRYGEELCMDILYQRKNGEDFWVDLALVPVRDEMEKHTNWLVILHDITDRKMNERQLITEKDRATETSRAKSNFLAEMSHEIRTPLNAIIGFADFMRHEYLGELGNDKYKSYAEDIHESGKYLLTLINSVLDFSKIESGHAELNETEFDLAGVLKSCVDMLKYSASKKNIELIADLESGLPYFRGDETKIKQIAVNLLSNAIKFTPDSGRVVLSLHHIPDMHHLRLQVSDTGIGIPEEEIERALMPYRRTERSLTVSKNTEGTGLGLPVSKAMAELHGGDLSIESKLNEGTSVVIILPDSRLAGNEAGMDKQSGSNSNDDETSGGSSSPSSSSPSSTETVG